MTIRDTTKGKLRVDILHQRVWPWDGEEKQAQHWDLVVCREVKSSKIKHSLSNALEKIISQLAKSQVINVANYVLDRLRAQLNDDSSNISRLIRNKNRVMIDSFDPKNSKQNENRYVKLIIKARRH